MDIMDIAPMFLSAIALAVSIVAVCFSFQSSGPEYAYRGDPQIEITVTPSEDSPSTTMGEIQVSVVGKNNLNRAFVIHRNNRVEQLELDDIEDTLAEKIKSGLDTQADIVSKEREYRYFFLYLEEQDDESNLHLIYAKSLQGSITFHVASGIEVYGLGNESHENAEAYAGERIMAEEYVRILKELPKYMGQ